MNDRATSWTPQFRLRTFLVACIIASIAAATIVHLERSTLKATLRRDLNLQAHEQLSLLESSSDDARKDLQHALVLVTDATDYRLVRVTRRRTGNPNRSTWEIDSVREFYLDGLCETHFFERRFDHYPSKEEIAAFKTWVTSW